MGLYTSQHYGEADYIILGHANMPANNAAKSIGVWFKAGSYAQNMQFVGLLCVANSQGTQIGVYGGTIVAWRWGGTLLADTGLAPTVNTLHHMVYTYDGVNSSKIYLDGALKDTRTRAEAAGTVDEVQFMGSAWWENGIMTIASCKIYDRALSDDEVKTLYVSQGVGVYEGLLSWWYMQEKQSGQSLAAASEVKDLWASRNNGISFNLYNRYSYSEEEVRFKRKLAFG